MNKELLGQHLLVDVKDVSFEVLNNVTFLCDILRQACIEHQMTILGEIRHAFDPQGVSIVFLLSESHASIHTWPEYGKACIDLFSCNTSTPMDSIAEFLKDHLYLTSSCVRIIRREI